MIRLVNAAAVSDRIVVAFDRYEREAYNIMKFYAAQATAYFMQVQGSVGPEQRGKFWTNHTMKAVEGFFSKAFQVPGNIGVTFANSTFYAKYLEENYDGKYAALPTILETFYPLILRDLKVLYGDET